MLLAFDDNQSLLKISGGDLSLFEKSTRDFLALVSKHETSRPKPKPAERPEVVKPADQTIGR